MRASERAIKPRSEERRVEPEKTLNRKCERGRRRREKPSKANFILFYFYYCNPSRRRERRGLKEEEGKTKEKGGKPSQATEARERKVGERETESAAPVNALCTGFSFMRYRNQDGWMDGWMDA
jgi:hypothetical protein